MLASSQDIPVRCFAVGAQRPVNAGQQFFGTVSRGLATLIEKAVGQWGTERMRARRRDGIILEFRGKRSYDWISVRPAPILRSW
jgi:hypothetical protein